MRTNTEILDELGERIIKDCFDGYIKQVISLRVKENPPAIFKEKCDFLRSLTDDQFSDLKKILRGSFEVSFFEFFKIFEENPHYKILYSEGSNEVDLTKISEMLKAEHMIEDGWIDRFSEYSNETK